MAIPSNGQRVKAKRDIFYKDRVVAHSGDEGTWQGSYVIFDKDKFGPYRSNEYPLCIAVMWSIKSDNVGDIAEIKNDLEYLEIKNG